MPGRQGACNGLGLSIACMILSKSRASRLCRTVSPTLDPELVGSPRYWSRRCGSSASGLNGFGDCLWDTLRCPRKPFCQFQHRVYATLMPLLVQVPQGDRSGQSACSDSTPPGEHGQGRCPRAARVPCRRSCTQDWPPCSIQTC